MGPRKPTRRIEIGVDEAAALLGVSMRMVRHYLDEKQIKGLKVGRKWFIDLASVNALQQSRTGNHHEDKPQTSGSLPESPAEVAEAPAEVAEVAGQRSPGYTDPRQLAPFRLFNQWLDQESCRQEMSVPEASTRFKSLQTEALAEMGAGYYSFGPDKIFHYQRARGAIGGILGLIYSLPDQDIASRKPGDLEHKVMPAFASLLKALEKKSRSKKPRSGGEA